MDGDSARILVVDDEGLLRWALRQRLEQAGYRVLEAGTVREARARIAQGVDLVLLDLLLPDANGLDLLRGIRAERPECRVVVMTSQRSPEAFRQAEAAGSFRCVEKPFPLEEMVELVAEALEAGDPPGASPRPS